MLAFGERIGSGFCYSDGRQPVGLLCSTPPSLAVSGCLSSLSPACLPSLSLASVLHLRREACENGESESE